MVMYHFAIKMMLNEIILEDSVKFVKKLNLEYI